MTGTTWQHQREVREALQTIVSDPQLGIAVQSNAPTMSNLLKDLLPDAPRETSVLVAAAEAGLAQILLDHVSQGMDAATAASLTASAFAARTPFTPEACDWVVAELSVALGIAPGEPRATTGGPAATVAAGALPVAGGPVPRDKAETLPAQRAVYGVGYGRPAAGPTVAGPGYAPGYGQPAGPGYGSPAGPGRAGPPKQKSTKTWGIVTAADYEAGLAELNLLTGFGAGAAGHGCPPPSGRTRGQSRWHSNDNANLGPRAGQILECFPYSRDSRIPIYLWTLPTQRVILVATDQAAGATYASLGDWWSRLSYG